VFRNMNGIVYFAKDMSDEFFIDSVWSRQSLNFNISVS
jgi:hypothetical protein